MDYLPKLLEVYIHYNIEMDKTLNAQSHAMDKIEAYECSNNFDTRKIEKWEEKIRKLKYDYEDLMIDTINMIKKILTNAPVERLKPLHNELLRSPNVPKWFNNEYTEARDDYIKIIKRLENQTLPKISEGSKQNEHHAVESEMKTGHLNSNKIRFPNIKNKGVQVPIEELKKLVHQRTFLQG